MGRNNYYKCDFCGEDIMPYESCYKYDGDKFHEDCFEENIMSIFEDLYSHEYECGYDEEF